MASGASWWYNSSRFGHWVNLATNPSRNVSFSDANGDGLCDVTSGTTRLTKAPFESFSVLNTVVPALVGLNQANAVSALANAGLPVGTVSQAVSAAPFGTVIGVSLPGTGNPAQVGTTINITLSLGGVAVPATIGASQSAAISSISGAGLAVGSVGTAVNSAAPGTVIGQSPAAGTIVQPGSAVSLTVSLGAATVPNVISDTSATAQSRIRSAGLTVGRVSTVNNCLDPGYVQSQSPSGGAVVAPGTSVDITVSTCTTPPGGGGNPRQPL
jgi:serine/threonine-protein kinase